MVDPQVGMVTLFGNRSGSRPVADLVSTQMAAESLGCDKICWGGNCHNGLLSMSVVAGVVVCFCGCGHDWFFCGSFCRMGVPLQIDPNWWLIHFLVSLAQPGTPRLGLFWYNLNLRGDSTAAWGHLTAALQYFHRSHWQPASWRGANLGGAGLVGHCLPSW